MDGTASPVTAIKTMALRKQAFMQSPGWFRHAALHVMPASLHAACIRDDRHMSKHANAVMAGGKCVTSGECR
jgi:hypothetical protein